MNVHLKQLVLAVAATGLALRQRLRNIADAGALTILNLHRVAPADGSTYPPLDPNLFRGLLDFLVREFEIVTFGELDEQRPRGKPPLVLSFDDGYQDFLEYAVPILEEKGVRANQNVIPACVDSGRPPFNVVVQDFIGVAPEELVRRLDIPGMGPVNLSKGRIPGGNAVSAHLKSRSMREQQLFEAELRPQLDLWQEFRPTPMMTRAGIASIANVHEIGAHSYEHASMAFEGDDYVRADAHRCRQWFAQVLEAKPSIYALPNGEFKQDQLQFVHNEGFETILLVGEDFSRSDTRVHKRFSIYGADLRELKFRAVGGLRRPKQKGSIQ